MKKILQKLYKGISKNIRISVSALVKYVRIVWILIVGIFTHKKKSMSLKRWVGAIVSIYILIGIVLGYIVYTQKPYILKTREVVGYFPLPGAYVNGSIIMVKPMLFQVSYIQKFSQQSGQQVDDTHKLIEQVVSQQINDTLVRQKLNILGESIARKDVDDAFTKIANENGGDKEVEKVLASLYGMNVSQFKSLISMQLQKDKLQQKGIQKAKVWHILASDETQAKIIIKDIQDGKRSFEDEAKEHSKDANSRDKGGDLGEINRGSMPQAFDDVAFEKAELGKVYGEPVKTDFGFHVVKVDSRSGSINLSFDKWLEGAQKDAKIIRFLK